MGNFSFFAAIETVDANIALKVNDSIQDCSNSIDFAVTYSDSINISKTNSDSTERFIA